MNNLYRELDQGERKQTLTQQNKFDLYRNKARNNNATPRTSTQSQVIPKVQREYLPAKQVKKRYSANDLTDSEGDGSLWAGEGNKSYLFTNQKNRRAGDIILINIMDKFKKEISLELARMFPKTTSAPPINSKKTTKTAPPPPPPQEDSEETAGPATVHDRISGIIVEEISNDHILIKGRKNLLYKKKKRTIEIQALVSKKDISDNDEVDSDNFLESTIQVLR